eukprot:m51a1_g10782 hypothetical protein (223) ;mRNA; r:53513-54421
MAASDSVKEYFNQTASKYDTAKPWHEVMQQQAAEALVRELGLGAATRCLEFGSGTGNIAVRIAPRVAELVAVDISEGMCDQLRKKIAGTELEGRIRVVCGDVTAAGAGHDCLYAVLSMHHVEDTMGALRSFASCVRPGGAVAVIDLLREEPGKTEQFHPQAASASVFHHGFVPDDFAAKMRLAGFADVSVVPAALVIPKPVEGRESEGPKDFPLMLAVGRRA